MVQTYFPPHYQPFYLSQKGGSIHFENIGVLTCNLNNNYVIYIYINRERERDGFRCNSLFFKPLDLSRFNGKKRLSLMLIF